MCIWIVAGEGSSNRLPECLNGVDADCGSSNGVSESIVESSCVFSSRLMLQFRASKGFLTGTVNISLSKSEWFGRPQLGQNHKQSDRPSSLYVLSPMPRHRMCVQPQQSSHCRASVPLLTSRSHTLHGYIGLRGPGFSSRSPACSRIKFHATSVSQEPGFGMLLWRSGCFDVRWDSTNNIGDMWNFDGIRPGARPTKHISIEFEIRWKFKTL